MEAQHVFRNSRKTLKADDDDFNLQEQAGILSYVGYNYIRVNKKCDLWHI